MQRSPSTPVSRRDPRLNAAIFFVSVVCVMSRVSILTTVTAKSVVPSTDYLKLNLVDGRQTIEKSVRHKQRTNSIARVHVIAPIVIVLDLVIARPSPSPTSQAETTPNPGGVRSLETTLSLSL